MLAMICWDITQCSDVVGYKCFRKPYCLHLQGEHLDARNSGYNSYSLLSYRTDFQFLKSCIVKVIVK
jgi:hypothetical protein